MLTVLVMGSSLVEGLEKFDKEKVHRLKCGRYVRLIYRGFSGYSFGNFTSPQGIALTNGLLQCQPDFVLTIMGANSISTLVTVGAVTAEASQFFYMLRDMFKTINPQGQIIASQLPLRFVRDPRNKHHTPSPKVFKRFRDRVNAKLCSLKTIDHILAIGGPGRLDDERFFKKDKVHLKPRGLDFQLQLIKNKLFRILNPKAEAPKEPLVSPYNWDEE